MKDAKFPTIQSEQDADGRVPGRYVVDAGYYGMVDPERIAWTVNFVDRKTAERIVLARKVINEIVADNGGRARIYVEFNDDDTVTVTEYDWKDWTETRSL